MNGLLNKWFAKTSSRPQLIVLECLVEALNRPDIDCITAAEAATSLVDEDTSDDARQLSDGAQTLQVGGAVVFRRLDLNGKVLIFATQQKIDFGLCRLGRCPVEDLIEEVACYGVSPQAAKNPALEQCTSFFR